jgi:hypothetical protein
MPLARRSGVRVGGSAVACRRPDADCKLLRGGVAGALDDELTAGRADVASAAFPD